MSRSFRIALCITVFAFIVFYSLTRALSSDNVPSTSISQTSSFPPSQPLWTHDLPKHEYAYAGFLAAPEENYETDDEDLYFVATRMLAYQLLHDPKTKTNTSIPFLVLVTEEIAESKRERLRLDGAIVLEVPKLNLPSIHPSRDRWRDVMSKLYLWHLTQYQRILFLDSDMLIAKRLDAIFDDGASQLQQNRNKTDKVLKDEGTQPSSYVFGGVSGQGGYDHPYPPRTGRAANAGFILIKPDVAMFEHYLAVASIEGRFDSKYPEQNLWIYVHRPDGNMPWQQITSTWNANWATIKDYDNGVATLHTKWWGPKFPDEQLRDLMLKSKWKMEGNAEAQDQLRLEGKL